MNGRTHLLLGLASGFAVSATVPPTLHPHDFMVKAGIILLAGSASLLPDIDHPKSIISGYLIGFGGAVRLLASHRTWTHSLIFAVLMCLAAFVGSVSLFPQVVTATALGIGSHLAADMLTPAGVPLLLPLSRRAFRLAPYPILKATSWLLESVATVGAVACIGFVVWKGL